MGWAPANTPKLEVKPAIKEDNTETTTQLDIDKAELFKGLPDKLDFLEAVPVTETFLAAELAMDKDLQPIKLLEPLEPQAFSLADPTFLVQPAELEPAELQAELPMELAELLTEPPAALEWPAAKSAEVWLAEPQAELPMELADTLGPPETTLPHLDPTFKEALQELQAPPAPTLDISPNNDPHWTHIFA